MNKILCVVGAMLCIIMFSVVLVIGVRDSVERDKQAHSDFYYENITGKVVSFRESEYPPPTYFLTLENGMIITINSGLESVVIGRTCTMVVFSHWIQFEVNKQWYFARDLVNVELEEPAP